MKKLIALMLSLLFGAAVLIGCAQEPAPPEGGAAPPPGIGGKAAPLPPRPGDPGKAAPPAAPMEKAPPKPPR